MLLELLDLKNLKVSIKRIDLVKVKLNILVNVLTNTEKLLPTEEKKLSQDSLNDTPEITP